MLLRAAAICLFALGLFAADPAWIAKPAPQWTEDDARQVLTASPWVRETRAGITRRLGEDELRTSGQMGQPHGIGYDGVESRNPEQRFPTRPTDIFTPDPARNQPPAVQSIGLRLRWESALPVRIAELKAHEIEPPTSVTDGYRLAVYGLPGFGYKGDLKKLAAPLKDGAVLKREGKKDVKPSSVEVFSRSDGWAVVYLFPLSAEVSERDRQIEFNAQIGRIIVVQRFDLAEMKFQGKLEI